MSSSTISFSTTRTEIAGHAVVDIAQRFGTSVEALMQANAQSTEAGVADVVARQAHRRVPRVRLEQVRQRNRQVTKRG